MHCIWTLPEGDTDYSGRWRIIKTRFSKAIAPPGARSPAASGRRRGVWQHRFWEHTIRDEQDYNAHMDYVHFNPVKHGLVAHPADWPYSTFKICAARGLYDPSWTVAKAPAPQPDMGERH